MKVLALVSGGKDSCYSVMQCVAAGHDIVALANLYPPAGIEELDSFMYQSVGYDLIPLYAEAMGLPLFRREIHGMTRLQSKDYQPTDGDEVEDLLELIKEARKNIMFDAIATGAIFSDYQRIRVENVCSRLNLVSFAYLWKRDQEELLQEMLEAGIRAIVIKVACLGLEPNKHLGKELNEIQFHLQTMAKKFGINVCGEGGEYETFTLDCPLFESSIEIDEMDSIVHSADAFAPVAFLKIGKAHLSKKFDKIREQSLRERLASVKIKTSADFLSIDQTNKAFKVSENSNVFSFISKFNVGLKITTCEFKDGLFEIKGLVGNGSCITTSVRHVMNQLIRLLEQNDMTLDNLILVNVFISKMNHYAEFNEEFKTFFTINPPSRALVEVNLDTDVNFYMNCTATRKEKETLHVQSISHWAPANIGPYSQAVKTNQWIYTAGQIALIPGSMDLLNADCFVQSQLILKHIDRVLAAVCTVCSLRNVVSCVCYLKDNSFSAQTREKLKELMGKDILVSFVMISELPRNADVEWQVLAHLEPEKWTFSSRKIQHKSYLTYTEIMTNEKEQLATIRLLNSPENDREGLVEILKISFKKFCGGFELKDVTIYISRKELDNAQILYELILTDFPNTSVSVIPVLSLEEDSSLLIMLKME